MYLSEGGAFGSVPDGYLEYRASKALGGGGIAPWEWAERDDWWMERILAFESAENEAQNIMARRATRKNRR